MKRIVKYILPIIITALCIHVDAQIYSDRNMVYEDLFQINPSAANLTNNTSVLLSTSIAGNGIDNAPNSNNLLFRTSIDENMGAGLRLSYDQRGLFNTTDVVGSYAYAVKLAANHKLHFGLSLGVNIQKFDAANANVLHANDPRLQESTESEYTLMNEFGLHYTWDALNVGFVAPYLFQGYNRYIAYTSYSYDTPWVEKLQVMPNVMYQYLPEDVHQVDMGLKFKYDPVWVAYTYRTNNDMVFAMGVGYLNFNFAYAYEFNNSTLSNITGIIHEVMLSYNFDMSWSKGKASHEIGKMPWQD